ncbi:putative gustatory receptor 28b [Diabrotica undecimpunctata]|uniref:putative gustatory receptor 28b n=1 Tax=Diabrotica undecimpunctata TaxID=50387 RepID=UPI003B64270A
MTLPSRDNVALPSVVKLKNIRKLHFQLCAIAKDINSHFSLQLLLIIGVTFVEFVNHVHKFIGSLTDDTDSSSIFNYNTLLLVILPLKIWDVIAVCVLCSYTKYEVNLTGDILFNIQNKYDLTISKEIQIFSRQILQWKFKFTAFDFIDVDTSLIYEIIATAATYLTIIIQFDSKIL